MPSCARVPQNRPPRPHDSPPLPPPQTYQVLMCGQTSPHDWSSCALKHPGEKVRAMEAHAVALCAMAAHGAAARTMAAHAPAVRPMAAHGAAVRAMAAHAAAVRAMAAHARSPGRTGRQRMHQRRMQRRRTHSAAPSPTHRHSSSHRACGNLPSPTHRAHTHAGWGPGRGLVRQARGRRPHLSSAFSCHAAPRPPRHPHSPPPRRAGRQARPPRH